MKNDLQFTGEVVEIFPTQTITSADGTKSWEKREVRVVEFDEQYPQSITLEVFGADKIPPIFNQFAVGDRVAFWYNTRSNAFDKKDGTRASSNSNGIWKCVKQSANQTYQAPAAQTVASPPPFTEPTPPPVGGDDLPF